MQHDLGQKERQENLQGAFQVVDQKMVAGKTVLLCDDVYTTGATFHECARTLLADGARKVFCIAVADHSKGKFVLRFFFRNCFGLTAKIIFRFVLFLSPCGIIAAYFITRGLIRSYLF